MQEGGAALCALRICNALRNEGIECNFLSRSGIENENISKARQDPFNWSKNKIIRFLQKCFYILGLEPDWIKFQKKIINAQKTNKEQIYFTSPISNYKSLVNHPWVKEADIIHIHWVGNFLDIKSFFKKIDKPVVWTFHDLNPTMGGFHYTKSYKIANKTILKLEAKTTKIKNKALENFKKLYPIAISQHMKKKIENCNRFKNYHITLINNGVNTNNYIPLDKFTVRKELEINSNSIVFLYSSFNIHDPNKGLMELIKALEILNIENTILICIGKYNYIPKTQINIRCVGFVKGDENLRKYYSAANYFIMPSYQESFGQTPLEAMSCGIPVCAFPTGIIPELINESNGIVCKDFSTKSLIEGIKLLIKREYNPLSIREDIIKRFSYEKIAKDYINLYKGIIKKENRAESHEKFSILSKEFIQNMEQREAEAQKDISIFKYLDEKREFYKMALTHPRYIAGWIKRKIFKK